MLKIVDGWTLADEGVEKIPSGLEIPKDIQQHFDYNVPLLDRQIKRLKELIADFDREQYNLLLLRAMEEEEAQKQKKKQELIARREELLQNQSWYADMKQLEPWYQAGVIVFLEKVAEREFLATEVCRHLINYHEAPDDRYSSGTYKIFPYVCIFLDYLVECGELAFLGKRRGIDRLYRLVKNNR